LFKKIKFLVRNFLKVQSYVYYGLSKSQINQIQISNQYRLMKKNFSPSEMPSMNDVGFKVHSQFEEDGILLYIFSMIGAKSKKVLEICAGEGIESMSANLIINHGWEGLLFDGDKKLVENGLKFFGQNEMTWLHPPIFKQAWITRENSNDLISKNGFSGEIDLLSLDLDGNDYHIMEAMNVVKPRVIICETHNAIPSEKALTIPYKSDFNRMTGPHIDFMSVSLLAMTKLLNAKGYRLVGSNRFGFNAVFILKGLGEEYFPEVSVESVHRNSFTKQRRESAWNKIKDLPWISV